VELRRAYRRTSRRSSRVFRGPAVERRFWTGNALTEVRRVLRVAGGLRVLSGGQGAPVAQGLLDGLDVVQRVLLVDDV
jgi:hypothetical protein